MQELVEVFSVVEVGGRPPLGGKAGTKGEWTIGGLVLPVPGDMRRAFVLPHYGLVTEVLPRLPTRPHKRGINPHPPLSLIARILPRRQIAL